jgi:D-alanine-D-alanine ligase-like ATP-grasp enzyme
MFELGLTFGAADFIDETFLEINTMPMFVAFDQVADGAIAKSIYYGLRG